MYIHTYIRSYIHTYMRSYCHTYIHTFMHACMHTYTHTHICIYTYIVYISAHTAACSCSQHQLPATNKQASLIRTTCQGRGLTSSGWTAGRHQSRVHSALSTRVRCLAPKYSKPGFGIHIDMYIYDTHIYSFTHMWMGLHVFQLAKCCDDQSGGIRLCTRSYRDGLQSRGRSTGLTSTHSVYSCWLRAPVFSKPSATGWQVFLTCFCGVIEMRWMNAEPDEEVASAVSPMDHLVLGIYLDFNSMQNNGSVGYC